MYRLFLRKKKTLTTAMAVVFAAGAFQAGGCTISIDEGLLQQLAGLVGNVSFSGGPGHGHPPFHGPDFDDHDHMEDESGDDSSGS